MVEGSLAGLLGFVSTDVARPVLMNVIPEDEVINVVGTGIGEIGGKGSRP